MSKILWLAVCFVCLIVGSGIIAAIIHLLGLPAQIGTLFGGVLGCWLFILYMEKTM